MSEDSEDTVLQPVETQAQFADIVGATNRYRIIRHIGRGGMGAVVLAEDRLLARQVAIKKPLHESLESDDARWRFEGEGRAAAKLNSPFLCRVHDVAVWDGLPCLIMEYVAGESLSTLLRQQGPFPIQGSTGTSAVKFEKDSFDCLQKGVTNLELSHDIRSASVCTPDCQRCRSSAKAFPVR